MTEPEDLSPAFVQFRGRLLNGGQDPVRVDGQCAALVGQSQTAALPFGQHATGFPFQLGHLLGHRGRGQVQGLSRRGEASVVGDGMQHPQSRQVEHK